MSGAEASPVDVDRLSDEEVSSDDEGNVEQPAESAVLGDEGAAAATTGSNGKKKKKKKKKTAAQKKAAAAAAAAAAAEQKQEPAVLKIGRNKHMKYISSYHVSLTLMDVSYALIMREQGPWLQLPHEVLDQLLNVNCSSDSGIPLRRLFNNKSPSSNLRQRFSALPAPDSQSGDNSARNLGRDDDLNDDDAQDAGARRLPPPIDPAVFRGVTAIRKLVDEASDLAVRAASGMSAAALGALNQSNGMNMSNTLGLDQNQNGRNAAMSPIRQHRLRKMAVSKLAEAYRIDEIAASVAVMQGATGLDDVALKVLKNEPDCLDAQYVHFFHEKIPSRTLAISTDSTILDQLIMKDPKRLEFYRTRGIVHGFKQDYASSIRNFTQALTQVKSARKAKEHHDLHGNGGHGAKASRKKGKTKAGHRKGAMDERAASDSTGAYSEGAAAANIGKEAGDDIERQLLFHRGMAYFHSACKLIEEAVLAIEKVDYPPGGLSNEGGELTLRNIGIALKDENAGLFGCADAKKQERYKQVLSDETLRDRVHSFLRRSIRDMERFLAYFAVWEAPAGTTMEDDNKFASNPRSTEKPLSFRGRRLIHHRSLGGRNRYSDPRVKDLQHGDSKGEPPLLTTYHPLLIEAHFSILLNHLLLGDFAALVPLHYRALRLMETLEGYPTFLPARSLNQSEYAELLERLGSTWLKEREANGTPAPEGTEHDVVLEGDLKSLHHLVSFFTDDFVEALIAAAEAATREAKDDARANKSSSRTPLAITDSNSSSAGGSGSAKGTWAEQREQAEAERRKIDPSYAIYNTARAEVALAWLSAVVLPEKELEERQGHAKGKASTEGQGHGFNGSFSATAEEDYD